MNLRIQVLSVWMLLVLVSCHKDPGYRVSSYNEIKIEEVPEDVKIPSKAWDLLEFKGDAHAAADHGGGGEHGGGHGGGAPAASATKNIVFSEVALYLVQKNDDVIVGEAIKVSFPKGGGTLDLSSYIGQQKGSFYLAFDFPQALEATSSKVLFMSRARKRKIGGQIFGAGCNQFFDITPQFNKAMMGEGLKLNTTQERYLSVIGGTFLFAAEKGNDIFLSQVTLTNSKYPQYFCEGR